MEEKEIKKQAKILQHDLSVADTEHHHHQELASKAYLRVQTLTKELDELREKCAHKYPKKSKEAEIINGIDGRRHCIICGDFNVSDYMSIAKD